jgi:hypothetical protein
MLRLLLWLLLITFMTGQRVSALSHIYLDSVISHKLRLNFSLLVQMSLSFSDGFGFRVFDCVRDLSYDVYVGLVCAGFGVFSVIWDIWGNLNFVSEVILLFFYFLIISTDPNSFVFDVDINGLVCSLIVVWIPRVLFYLIQCKTIFWLYAKQTFEKWFGLCW